MSDAIVPFLCEVPDAVLEDLRERLARTRWPEPFAAPSWSYGCDVDYLRELCAYWQEGFDWRVHEAALNRFDQYTTEIDGIGVHFLHARSRHPEALPLVVTHGWPGSVLEFLDILEPLRDPTAHGGDARDAFHVVCPSIPGYGFSQAPPVPGLHARRVSEMWSVLMARLGYERYGAQGGDWGSMISQGLGVLDPERCVGIHVNMIFAPPPKDEANPEAALSDAEQAALVEAQRVRLEEMGYYHVQSTRPQSLAVGLGDSPAGLAAWIIEKFRSWSDCGGDLEASFTKDQLLANLTLYWATNTIASSVRLYCETRRATGLPSLRHRVPVGYADFPGEPVRPPRRWVERLFELRQWTDMPRGGHFAAMEEPGLLAEDVRRFFRPLRGAMGHPERSG